jgi:hypothetical protein
MLIVLGVQQKQQLACRQETLPESEPWLDSLNDEFPDIRIEKDNLQISKTCERARTLLKSIKNLVDTNLSVDQILEMIKEMHDLDQLATTWRQGPQWAYKTIHRSEITQDDFVAYKFPEFVQLHDDVWIAYEWNYHRTGRIILHGHLLECIDRLESLCSASHVTIPAGLCSLREASITVIQALADQVLSAVPQSLGDIDHEGNLMVDSSTTAKCKGAGAYFLLWPIKIIKGNRSVTAEQRSAAQGVFERIRECTGMKSALGDLSCI